MRSELSWAAAGGAGLALSTERGAEAREELGIRARAAGGVQGSTGRRAWGWHSGGGKHLTRRGAVSEGATGRVLLERIVRWHECLHRSYECFIIFKVVVLNCFPTGCRKGKF